VEEMREAFFLCTTALEGEPSSSPDAAHSIGSSEPADATLNRIMSIINDRQTKKTTHSTLLSISSCFEEDVLPLPFKADFLNRITPRAAIAKQQVRFYKEKKRNYKQYTNSLDIRGTSTTGTLPFGVIFALPYVAPDVPTI
jgi:hypothetical protein